MSDDRWAQLDALLAEALDLAPGERAAFLDARCPDPALRARLERLLADAERDSTTLAQGGAIHGAIGASLARAAGAGPEPAPPPAIDGFRFVRALGVGGMGIVWLAEQLEPVRRPVAIKVVRSGAASPQLIARFESERQALALMSHPHIARVYDGGTTREGHPYFVMEYVPGLPITEHCATKRLTTRERLELFIAVCDAVHHAHLRGIIHRDIKPSNVLVAEEEGVAVPKIIDFGIARALDQRLSDLTVHTVHGQVIGTPEYMSPEQAQFEPSDVDARSDVFALGILLYELLTGSRPFRVDAPGITSLDRLFSMIRSEDPPRPSQRLTGGGAGAASGTLARELRGDLDWIVMKALEKERDRRYGSAREFAEDLRRHLRHEPVSAGPPGTTYRLRKLMRRHRGAVTAAAAVAVALVAGLVVSSGQAVRAIRAEQAAVREAATAQRVTGFLVDLFQTSDPAEARGDTLTAREVLDRGRDRLQMALDDEPLVRARLLGVVADIYRRLGLYADAEPLFRQALDEQVRLLGPDALDVARSRQALARLAGDLAQDARADSLLRIAIARYEQAPAVAALDLAQARLDHSEIVRRGGDYAAAESLAAASLEGFEALAGDHRERIAVAWNAVGTARARLGRFADAEAAFRRSLEIQERVLGADHPQVALILTDLASTVARQGREADSEALARRALEITEKVYGPDHRYVATAVTNLAGALGRQGRLAEARALFTRSVTIRERVFGPDAPETAIDYKNLGLTCMLQADYPAARRWLQRSVAVDVRLLGPNHPRTAWSRTTLAGLYLRMDLRRDAAREFHAALDALRGSIGLEVPDAARCWRGLGDIALLEGRLGDADSLYAQSYAVFESSGGPKGNDLPPTLRRIGQLRLAQRRIGEAREKLEQALALGIEVYGRDDHPAIAEALVPLARTRAAGDAPDEAEALLKRALGIAEKAHGPDHPDVASALHGLGEVAAAGGRTLEARTFLERALEIRRLRLGETHSETRASAAMLAQLEGST